MNKQEAKKLEEKILKILNTHLTKNTKLITAVSGGGDSVFLFHMLLKISAKIIIAHVNHQLRKESANDAKFVQNLSKSHGIKVEILRTDIAKLAQKNKEGVEETGRKVRYDFFNKMAKKHQADLIITAHNADDNLETRLLNFTRGASLQGLLGMEIISSHPPKYSPQLFRPLLDIDKKEILAYLEFKKIPYRNDETNQDRKYSRNFLRHEIIPKLKKLNPNLIKTSAKNTQNLREIENFLNEEAEKWLKKNSKTAKAKTLLNAKTFKKLHTALQKTIIFAIYKTQIGHTKNLESSHLEDILKTLKSPHGNKKKTLNSLTFKIKNNIIEVS
ncbi:tRNA lysidine(34) synthetase TilS [Candidatus Peregrinibacteria bacterium]|nr:tRNA lysidine(34) synthetase TilS [Candidatus Peregrinibacteria bacterium]